MNGPSHIQLDQPKARPWAWKAYFWFLSFLNLVLAIFLLYDPEGYEASARDYVDLVVSTTGLVGLFGYCYQKRIAVRNFWKALFPIMMASDAFQISVENWSDPGGLNAIIIGIGVLLVLVLPLYIAIYRYGFKDENLWSEHVGLASDGAT